VLRRAAGPPASRSRPPTKDRRSWQLKRKELLEALLRTVKRVDTIRDVVETIMVRAT
jgi:hypothetical protein